MSHTVVDSDTDKANMLMPISTPCLATQGETNQSLPTDNLSHFSNISITEEDIYNAYIRPKLWVLHA